MLAAVHSVTGVPEHIYSMRLTVDINQSTNTHFYRISRPRQTGELRNVSVNAISRAESVVYLIDIQQQRYEFISVQSRHNVVTLDMVAQTPANNR